MAAAPEAGLRAQATIRPDAVALIDDDDRVTFAELDERARHVAGALVAAGVERGDRVAVMLPNRSSWFDAIHGCGQAGAVVVPVNIHFKADEVGWIVADSGTRAVIVDETLVDALASSPDVARLVVDDGGKVHGPDPVDVEVTGDGWPTTMVYTSGTTGRPKGVAIGEDDFRRTASGFALMGARWDIGPSDVHVLAGPAYHSGPAAWAQMHIAVGAPVVVMRRWDGAEFARLVERHRITTTHLVPANLIRILELPREELEQFDLSSLRLVVHAAAPCPVPVKRAFMELVGAEKVWEYYGASEGGGTVISPDEWLAHPGSVGRAFPGNEFRITDDDAQEVPAGVPGTIWARTSHSSFRYHNDPDKTAASHDGGWFTVGDVGYLDDDGYLFLTDRRSDMVISGGVNIYPREIENALFEHPNVVDCAVFGVPDDRWGESLAAVVQARPGSSLGEDDVVAWCRSKLADYKRPRLVELVDELPRDPNGKVAKRRLREAWLARRAE